MCRDKGRSGTLIRILFHDANGDRKSIRLGKVPIKVGEEWTRKITTIESCFEGGVSFPSEMTAWLRDLPDVTYAKFSKAGLVPARKKAQSCTLAGMCDRFLEKSVCKPGTLLIYKQTIDSMLRHFGATIALVDITAERADGWRRWLSEPHMMTFGRGRKQSVRRLAVATQAKRVEVCRQIFRQAVRWEVINKNPFEGVLGGSKVNHSRQRMISLPMIEAILENCPNHEWRAIFALCRYAGLRCPSEFVGLTWADVDWERGALRVKSPKTEHHPGHESRLVPVVPALRRVLEDCFEAAPVGSVLIVPRLRSSRSNLRTHAVRIIEKAGVQPWPKIFQNMRSSCETAWLEQYPVASVAGWLGHSREVCMKHYAQVLPEHFESAVNGDREKAAHFPAQQVAAEGVFHVAASRTTKNSDDENALENKAFQAVEENNEETKNRGDTIRTCGLYVPNVAL